VNKPQGVAIPGLSDIEAVVIAHILVDDDSVQAVKVIKTTLPQAVGDGEVRVTFVAFRPGQPLLGDCCHDPTAYQ